MSTETPLSSYAFAEYGHDAKLYNGIRDLELAHAVSAALLAALKQIIGHVEDTSVDRQPPSMCTLCHTYRMIGHEAIDAAEGR